jgi:hypothetical protein
MCWFLGLPFAGLLRCYRPDLTVRMLAGATSCCSLILDTHIVAVGQEIPSNFAVFEHASIGPTLCPSGYCNTVPVCGCRGDG